MKKTVFITGALGHIGSRLIRDLSPKAVGRIIMLDNLESKRFASLYDLPKHFSYRFIEGDIRTADFDKLFEGVDMCIHLAALSEAEKSVEYRTQVEEVNIEGLKRVVEGCIAKGVKLIFPSTTSVYGDRVPLVTEEGEIAPQSPYADSKFRGEEIIRSYKTKDLQFTIFRFATIYGFSPGMRFSTAVNRFVWQAVTGQPLSVWKTALKQKRPYLALEDCVQAINLILEKDIFKGEVYNVCTENATVEDVVSTIKSFIPSTEIGLVDSKVMNSFSYDLVAKKIRALGFSPKGNLHSGVSEIIEHFGRLTNL
ncbi:MAG: NAD-dependent epimerase/dehydratase [Parcubacteria group bacterium Gr01-1014_72]|nr:MAG: NAD-dependent epimerase/dehydratase [Parcubacteria group bacterium Gr01-1014_72]